MLAAMDNVREYATGVGLDDVKQNKMLRHALAYNVQIVGEAAYHLSKEFKSQHPETEWRYIEGMRHVLVHDYYQVDVEELWNVAQNDIPALYSQIESYLKTE